MTEVVAQDDTVTVEYTEPRLLFSLYLSLRLTSPNYAFMRRRLYRKQKVKYLLFVYTISTKVSFAGAFPFVSLNPMK